jgi:hypothetical protein
MATVAKETIFFASTCPVQFQAFFWAFEKKDIKEGKDDRE